MNQALVGILRNTPIWVWLLFAALVAVGYSRTRPRTTSASLAALLPVAMAVFSLGSTLVSGAGDAAAIACLGAAFAIGIVAGNRIGSGSAARPGPVAGSVHLPGEWWSLGLILSLFLSRYAFILLAVTNPALAASPGFWLVRAGTVGLLSGVFLGRSLTVVWLATRSAAGRRPTEAPLP